MSCSFVDIFPYDPLYIVVFQTYDLLEYITIDIQSTIFVVFVAIKYVAHVFFTKRKYFTTWISSRNIDNFIAVRNQLGFSTAFDTKHKY